MTKFQLYWHTLKYLKPIQFYGRLWFKFFRPKPNLSLPPKLRKNNQQKWMMPARRKKSLIEFQAFLFLNEQHSLDQIGWDNPTIEKLWRYNQHYFDDLNAVDANLRKEWHVALLEDWLKNNPPTKGSGWEPYPISLRIVNWIKWALNGNVLSPSCLHNLAIQARWLKNRLEIHLLGNHLFANAKAFVFAGIFFEGEEATDWFLTGINIIKKELKEQVLADGGHFERSTMYHALILEDILDLINLNKTYEKFTNVDWHSQLYQWCAHIDPMLKWLEGMCHPDGDISFFNDAAFGIAPSTTEIKAYASRLSFESHKALKKIHYFPQSGYVRLEVKDAVALIDIADIGPDYLPGHAHADTLSFEFSLFGARILVNTGTSCYGLSNQRLYERSTVAHNTVVINDENSSEVWSGFRVARRAYPIKIQIKEDKTNLRVEAAHTGYHRLKNQPTPIRTWHLNESEFVIEDCIKGLYQTAQAYFYFHPQVEIVQKSHHAWQLCFCGKSSVFTVLFGNARLLSSYYSPEFGVKIDSHCLVVDLVEGKSKIVLSW
jgi:uncharacterized heparinase superfamily protein